MTDIDKQLAEWREVMEAAARCRRSEHWRSTHQNEEERRRDGHAGSKFVPLACAAMPKLVGIAEAAAEVAKHGNNPVCVDESHGLPGVPNYCDCGGMAIREALNAD